MNDRQIKAFVEAARLLNFTKAADKLYVPQSQVSRAIKGLESYRTKRVGKNRCGR